MRDLLAQIGARWRAAEPVAVATVIATFDSSPRGPGASMFVASDGSVLGSISGGCVEGAVYEVAQGVLATGVPELHRFGVSDGDAFAVGLTCGGTIDVFVEIVERDTFPGLGAVLDAESRGEPVAMATVVDHPSKDLVGARIVPGRDGNAAAQADLLTPGLSAAIVRDAAGLLSRGETKSLTYGVDGQAQHDEVRVFVESFAPRARLIIFGAIDFAASLATLGKFLGYAVTVCDARPVFATSARFPGVDDIVVDWPHRYLAGQAVSGVIDERTVICVLTHDPKFDVPLLEVALRLPFDLYVGAMGSRRTHERRLESLRDQGLTDAELERLSSPIGLDLGARTPEETAVSIAAEVIERLRGGTGRPLRNTEGRIHQAR